MLVLSRKIGERIIIGQDIIIEVVKIHKGRVHLDIQAPKDVLILRSELLKDKQDDETHPSRC